MRILILNWRDPDNPKAGGAEQATYEIFSRIAAKGHEVTWFSGMFKGASAEEDKDGIKYIRRGGQATVHYRAWRWYKRQLKNGVGYDLVIDEINTIPFLSPLYVKAPRVTYINQLARGIWFYEVFFPLGVIGYLLEGLYLRIYRKEQIVTISQSTKQDLLQIGCSDSNIYIVDMGLDIKPVTNLKTIRKEERLTLLYFGSLRPMKRVAEAIKVFSYVKQSVPSAQMWIAGSGDKKNKAKLEQLIVQLNVNDSVEFKGLIPREQKGAVLGHAHFLLVTSVREGWGLVVIEANASGTPAAVYDVPGLRDSVLDGVTGIVSPNSAPQRLAARIIDVIKRPEEYENMRINAYDRSKTFSWNRTADAFYRLLRDKCKSLPGVSL